MMRAMTPVMIPTTVISVITDIDVCFRFAFRYLNPINSSKNILTSLRTTLSPGSHLRKEYDIPDGR